MNSWIPLRNAPVILETSRSELADAILAAFFKSQDKPLEKGRKLVILRRKRLV